MTSSGLGVIPVAGTAVYAATKAYASSFAQALSYELEDKIDVIDWPCGEVRTRLLGDYGAKNPRAVSAELAVKGLLESIGHERVTWGPRTHETGLWQFTSMPVGFMNKVMFKGMSRVHKERMEGKNEEEMEAYIKKGVY